MTDTRIIANWKMNGSGRQLRRWIDRVAPVAAGTPTAVGLCLPFPLLPLGAERLAGTAVGLGAQDVSEQAKGAFTGEVSAELLAECGCRMVIVGHSERRSRFAESDALIAAKAQAARQAGITPVLCIGETAEQKRAGQARQTVAAQIAGLTAALTAPCILAYEPVWAIGTGLSATTADIDAMHRWIAGRLPAGLKCPLLYGGSINRDNIAQITALDSVNGALVGSASLDPEHFSDLLLAAK